MQQWSDAVKFTTENETARDVRPSRPAAGRRGRWALPAAAAVFAVGALFGWAAPAARATGASVGLSANSVSFGSQNVGTTSATMDIKVTNNGPGTLSITGASRIGADAGDFAITAGSGAATLGVGEFQTISVTFTPTATGDRTAQIQINDDGTGSPQVVSLTGTGTAPAVSLTPTTVNFPLRAIGSPSPAETILLKNTGTGPLKIINVTFGSPVIPDYHFTGGDSSGTLAPMDTRMITVVFTPTAVGPRNARVDIITDAPTNPDHVFLHGIGIATGSHTSPPVPTNVLLFVSAINGTPTTGLPDQVFVSVGQCVTLTMLVKFRVGEFVDVTDDPNTTFFTDPPRHGFARANHSNVFCPTAADANHTFTLYGRSYSPAGQQAILGTVIVHVRRDDGKS